MPHIAPVGWRLDPDAETIVITGRDFAATKKFRDVANTGQAAIVVDDVLPPWQPRGLEIRGRAIAIDGAEPQIQIQPTRIRAHQGTPKQIGQRAEEGVTGDDDPLGGEIERDGRA